MEGKPQCVCGTMEAGNRQQDPRASGHTQLSSLGQRCTEEPYGAATQVEGSNRTIEEPMIQGRLVRQTALSADHLLS